ncbi:hypothetical protein A3K80_08465 [Candidatus Bathyarchaeota archaeon RBG_13_38_9]|nr:MAG: hypothetical protein A3K80_08465 [Candidatus Bathyarchaeota archaeon RBG_13_38_9]
MLRNKIFILSIFIALLLLIQNVNAAPSGSIDLDPSISADNFLSVGEDEVVLIIFNNTAGAPITDVASTIQYLSVSVAVRNPTLISIALGADITIHNPDGSVRVTSFPVTGTLESTLFVPPGGPSTPEETVDLYTWSLGPPSGTLSAYTDSSQFVSTLKILRPAEYLTLSITVTCAGVGDSVSWFFFRATEDAFSSGSYPTAITAISDKKNLYYSKLPGPDATKYWLPLHNSYDPYDIDLLKGHVFDQNTWTRSATNTSYAKTNKIHHQSPKANGNNGGGDPLTSVIHICGIKFLDLNRDGIYNINTENGINGFEITLLGPDLKTKAEEFYSGSLQISEAHGNPVMSGEEGKALPGVYCFNLINVKAGTYTFYVEIKESEGYKTTTPTSIGPIMFQVDNDPGIEFFNVGNNFGNTIYQPVGGIITPANRVAILMPFIVFIGLVGIVSSIFVLWRRRRD